MTRHAGYRRSGDAKPVVCRGNAADATVARLLLHTTGLPYGHYLCGDEVPAEKRRTNRDLLERAGVLAAAPGTRYQYTNIGYGLLEEIVREAFCRSPSTRMDTPRSTRRPATSPDSACSI